MLPQLACAVPAVHVPAAQQPPLQSWVGEQVVVQTCVVVLQAYPVGQSAAALQPHCPLARQTLPAVLAVQSTHAPLVPQAAFAVPGRQVLEAAAQQPAWHGVPGRAHAKLHRCVVVLQALAVAGQSPIALHPHCPPPVTAMQVSPPVPAVNNAPQSLHAAPLLPHVAVAVPATQVPAAQQPSLQSWLALQVVTHLCCVRSQALPLGQSLTLLQPQAPLARQAVPLTSPTQVPHTPAPVSAQKVVVLPGWHVPAEVAEQQPPLHSCVELQLVVHVLAESQDLPVGQSAVALQPQTPLKHFFPVVATVQSVHAPPAGPQAVSLIVRQLLVEPQQNPVPQLPPLVPPTTHCAVHALPWQVGVPPPQLVHAAPSPPQVALLVPAVHMLLSQQPPLHSCAGPQMLVHS